MKKLFTLLIVAFTSLVLTILASSVTVAQPRQSQKVMPGAISYQLSQQYAEQVQLENQAEVHQVFASARVAGYSRPIYVASDWASTVAIPSSALMPSRQRSRLGSYGRSFNTYIALSNYPGMQLNYLNRAVGQHPFLLPFSVARSNP